MSDLLEAGAAVDLVDMGGFSALMWACYKGNDQIVELLLNKHASHNIRDQHQISCLVWAAGRGHTNAVQMLLQHGAKDETGDKVLRGEKANESEMKAK